MSVKIIDSMLGGISMKENKYDNEIFFKKYSEMNRSQNGLEGAGEWSELFGMWLWMALFICS